MKHLKNPSKDGMTSLRAMERRLQMETLQGRVVSKQGVKSNTRVLTPRSSQKLYKTALKWMAPIDA